MPMGIVSDSDFDLEKGRVNSVPSPMPGRLSPDSNESEDVEIKEIKKGRGKGSIEVPAGLRKLIGQESIENGREAALALARDFNISPSSVSAYSVGATSTADYDKRPNKPVIDAVKNRIVVKSKKKLMMALNHITDEKMADAGLKTISSVAKDMSAVIRNMEPEPTRNDRGGEAGPTFVFYSPVIKSEEHYDVINVKE